MPALWGSGGLRCCLCLRNQVFAADPCSSDFDLVQLSTAGSSSSSAASPASFGVSVHPACLRSSSGLGGGCCDHTTEQVLAEASRCADNKCSYCQRPGASVQCKHDGCGLTLHYPCLVLHGRLGRRKKADNYLCKDHAARWKAQNAAKKSVNVVANGGKKSRVLTGKRGRDSKKLKRQPRQPPAPSSPPLVCLASPASSQKGESFKCGAVRCRCPFGESFSDDDFWPVTKCIACSAKHAHRFCVRKSTVRGGVWTCGQCVLRGPKLCLLKKSKAKFMSAFDLKSPKNRMALSARKSKPKKKEAEGNNSPKVSPESQRNTSAIFSSMKMSFCRVIDTHLGNGAAEESHTTPKKRTDRSPLSLRQKESPGKLTLNKSAKAQSPMQPDNDKTATGGKENCQKRVEKTPSKVANGEVVKDAWILRQDLKDGPSSSDRNPPLPATSMTTIPSPPPKSVIRALSVSDPVESLPKGRRWTLGSPVKPLPKGWSYIIEDPRLNKSAEGGDASVVSQNSEAASSGCRSARASKMRAKEAFTTSPTTSSKSKSCTNTPKCSPTPTPVKADTSNTAAPPPPPGSASKKQSPKSGSGSSSPAKKFVDNSAIVDHGALVRKLDLAFNEQAEKKKKNKTQSAKKPPPPPPPPPVIARVPHGKKEKPRKVSAEFVPIEKRLLYHIRTTLPIDGGEPEAEEDYEWLVGMSDRMIDDFLDLNDGEKAFFKLWNAHLHRYPCYGDKMMIKILTLFVDECGERIARGRLYRNFLVHLASLHDFEVLDQDTVIHFSQVMRIKCRQVLFGTQIPEKGPDPACDVARSEINVFETRQEEGSSLSWDAETRKSETVGEKRESGMTTCPKSQRQRPPNLPFLNGNLSSSTSPCTRLSTRGRSRMTTTHAMSSTVSCPPSPCSSRQSSERSMKLYLSESEDENDESSNNIRSPPAKKAKRRRSNNAAVSYAGDKSVDRISDNGAVELGLCFSGTRRSAFATKAVLYPGRGRKRRRGEEVDKIVDEKTVERVKRVSGSRRGRPQRQRLLEEEVHESGRRREKSQSAPASPEKSPHKHGKRWARASL